MYVSNMLRVTNSEEETRQDLFHRVKLDVVWPTLDNFLNCSPQDMNKAHILYILNYKYTFTKKLGGKYFLSGSPYRCTVCTVTAGSLSGFTCFAVLQTTVWEICQHLLSWENINQPTYIWFKETVSWVIFWPYHGPRYRIRILKIFYSCRTLALFSVFKKCAKIFRLLRRT